MNKQPISFLVLIGILLFGCKSKTDKPFVVDSSGNINNINVVMTQSQWNGQLGQLVRDHIATVFEGLPLDEPRFTLRHIVPEAFTGFGRNGRNIIWCKRGETNSFQLSHNQYSKPQILAFIQGEDDEVMGEYIKENASLLIRTFQENERKEKIRRIKKSPTKEVQMQEKFKASILYPSAYKVVKDTLNFLWIEKPIQKGTMNLIAYRIPEKAFKDKSLKQVIKIRDSIGKHYVPGRLPKSHMITEKAYLPYFYKTELAGQKAYLTKGMWEVKKDFMAGPFVNYFVKEKNTPTWLVIEGFAFAPSVSKRDYMFELNTIITTFEFQR